jgi:hypothetical protein
LKAAKNGNSLVISSYLKFLSVFFSYLCLLGLITVFGGPNDKISYFFGLMAISFASNAKSNCDQKIEKIVDHMMNAPYMSTNDQANKNIPRRFPLVSSYRQNDYIVEVTSVAGPGGTIRKYKVELEKADNCSIAKISIIDWNYQDVDLTVCENNNVGQLSCSSLNKIID